MEDYNPTKKRKVLIAFNDLIADMKSNKKLSPIVTELFLRGRKLNISLVLISQSCFKVPEAIRLNTTYYFIMQIPNKRELQQIASNNLPDIEFKDFISWCKDSTKKPFLFLVNNTILPSDNPLRFRRNVLQNDYTHKIKAIDNKIEQSNAQYKLDKETTKNSALSSGNVSKYESLTGSNILPEKDLA